MTPAIEHKCQFYARVAGMMFLIYIVAGLAETSMFSYAFGSGSAASRLANLSERASLVHLSAALSLATIISALVLAVSLFAIARHHNLEVAVLGMCARTAEAVTGAIYMVPALGMLAVAHSKGPVEGAAALLTMLNSVRDGAMIISASCFAMGSTLFSFVFLRARSIPAWLAWFGLAASVLLIVALPLQLALGLRAEAIWFAWLPMLAFEIVLASWLLIKGVDMSRATTNSVR